MYVAWTGIALARETATAFDGWGRRQQNVPPCVWRLGMAPVERLRRCLAGAQGLLPRDAKVAFASPAAICSAQFFRWRWAAYLLPDQLVTLAGDPYDPGPPASYLISYRQPGTAPRGCGLTPLRQLDGGRLYRIDCP
jgi:hypothetical protein